MTANRSYALFLELEEVGVDREVLQTDWTDMQEDECSSSTMRNVGSEHKGFYSRWIRAVIERYQLIQHIL